MTKNDCKILVNELRNNISYSDIDTSVLFGCGLDDFPKGKIIRKEALLMHLRWQCLFLNGGIDEQELSDNLWIFKNKRIIMV